MKKADHKSFNKILWHFLKKDAQKTIWQAPQPNINRDGG